MALNDPADSEGEFPGQRSSSDATDVAQPKSPSSSYANLPISRLSDDILAKIFFIYHTISEWSDARAGALLSHVCHIWRLVALDTPRLWDNIDIRDKGTLPVELLEAQLQRTRGAPLDIFVHLSNPEGLWKLILDHLHRSRSLTIIIRDSHVNSPCDAPPIHPVFQSFLCGRAEFLEALYIGSSCQELAINFESAPRLTSLTLCGKFNWTVFGIFPALKVLDLRCSPESLDWLHVAVGCPTLEYLTVHGDLGPGHTPTRYTNASPTKLKSLRLSYIDPSSYVKELLRLFSSDSVKIDMVPRLWAIHIPQDDILSPILPSSSFENAEINLRSSWGSVFILHDRQGQKRIELGGNDQWTPPPDPVEYLFVLVGVSQLALLRQINLTYSARKPTNQATWKRLFLALPALEDLTLTLSFKLDERAALKTFFQALDDAEIFPCLQTFVFIRLNAFHEEVGNPDNYAEIIAPLFKWIELRLGASQKPSLRLIDRSGGGILKDQHQEYSGDAVVLSRETVSN